jgi:hypothetical protein
MRGPLAATTSSGVGERPVSACLAPRDEGQRERAYGLALPIAAELQRRRFERPLREEEPLVMGAALGSASRSGGPDAGPAAVPSPLARRMLGGRWHVWTP